MNLQKFIAELAGDGIEISLAGGDLKVNGLPDVLPTERLALIKRYKLQIMAILRSEAAGKEDNNSDEEPSYKNYKYPDGRTLALNRDEFYRVVDAVRILIKMDNEQQSNRLKGALTEAA